MYGQGDGKAAGLPDGLDALARAALEGPPAAGASDADLSAGAAAEIGDVSFHTGRPALAEAAKAAGQARRVLVAIASALAVWQQKSRIDLGVDIPVRVIRPSRVRKGDLS
jgi:hypothetical protein